MQAAEVRGLRTANGLGMLVYQAIYAFSFFTGVKVEEREMAKRLLSAVETI